jgi:DNA modification methylase
MNFQGCHQMAFVGLNDSYEAYYQCIRRCWRFGQKEPVQAHIILSDMEQEIHTNVLRKEAEAQDMAEKLIAQVAQYERAEIASTQDQEWQYETETVRGKGYTLMLGDSAERLKEIPDESAHLSVFSPPFLSLYTYSPTERDLGNSRTPGEFYGHFGFIIDQLLRVTKPGRNCCVHVAQIPAMLARDGYIGIKDFRGSTIEAFEARGWVYHGEVCIDKDPQAQAIRTHSKALLFAQLRKDSSWLRPALADYILIFRRPGENEVPIQPDLTNDEWIEWARPIWYGIKESDTLNVAEGRDKDDERHICPLQLGTIERCIRLWSNPGETVLSPFAGIGSEGYVSLKTGRKFTGCELKRSYFEAAKKNLARAVEVKTQTSLFGEAV